MKRLLAAIAVVMFAFTTAALAQQQPSPVQPRAGEAHRAR